MRIVIVAPSPVPFIIGGAENLWWGLQDYINAETSHQCELMKLPWREGNFWEILDSYESFSQIEVSSFDLVISTKYPAWMVPHRRHICYMQHKLRGLYDTYHFSGLPVAFSWEQEGLGALHGLMQRMLLASDDGGQRLTEFFGRVRELKNRGLPEEAFRFPGPFVRQIVHFLDAYGMAISRIHSYAAISQNVRRRGNYFPPGVDVSVLYHPPRQASHFCRSDDFLFTASRLDGPKRIGLLIDAMAHVKSDIPLIIAGTGPDEARLRELSQGDSRVRFLGYLRDSQMPEYYADALAVPFVPYDEDYGLITIEAMRSGKPVLTTADSGGPNEFVRNGETGYSVPADPKALAERIDYLCAHRSEARQMGANAMEVVGGIGWRAVVDGLLAEPGDGFVVVPLRHRRIARRKLVVATTFPVYPPLGGGQSRVFHLYRNLALAVGIDVDIVSLCNHDEPGIDRQIVPGIREIRVPKSALHHQKEAEYSAGVDWIPLTDVVMPVLYGETPGYLDALSASSRDAFAVVASHPYVLSAIEQCAPDKPLWFEAHNVEYDLKRAMFPDTEAGRYLLNLVRNVEKRAWHACDVVFACTRSDLETMTALYGEPSAVSLEVPNGVALDEIPFFSEDERVRLKASLGLQGKHVAVFMGSWHGPNLTAVQFLLRLSAIFPSVMFVIVGSAGLAFRDEFIPSNVLLTGPVDDKAKNILLGAADIALNPLLTGSGSNLKMLEYAASGAPILSTAFGARGFDLIPGTHYIAAGLDDYALELSAALASTSRRTAVAMAAKILVTSRYSWECIAEQFAASLAGRFEYLPLLRKKSAA
ncbi:MAG: glycosyltransferase family 4 protein [Steroidobacteraceae bacterium]